MNNEFKIILFKRNIKRLVKTGRLYLYRKVNFIKNIYEISEFVFFFQIHI